MLAPDTIAPLTPTTEIDAAYVAFLLALKRHRLRPLRALNSYGALQDRIANVEEAIKAMSDYAAALIEDTAPHVNLPRREADYVKAVIHDIASDVSGKLTAASRGVVTR
jgi:hypothetical protein